MGVDISAVRRDDTDHPRGRAVNKALDIIATVMGLAAGVGVFHLIAGLTWRSDLTEARSGFILAVVFAALSAFAHWLAYLVERAR